MNAVVIALCTGAMLASCTTSAYRPSERSDRPMPRIERAETVKQPARPGWQPGPGDTDGKPGEPNCPDCDGNGPVYHGSVRP